MKRKVLLTKKKTCSSIHDQSPRWISPLPRFRPHRPVVIGKLIPPSMAGSTPKSYHTDPTLYLYTSLTAGSSHIITATSRLETILKANKIPFLALDVATDEKARMLWGRRAGKRKLPGLVRMGMVVGVRISSGGF